MNTCVEWLKLNEQLKYERTGVIGCWHWLRGAVIENSVSTSAMICVRVTCDAIDI